MSAALLELVDAGIQIETAVPMQEFANEWRRVDPVSGAKHRNQLGVWGQRDDGDVLNWIMTAAAPGR